MDSKAPKRPGWVKWLAVLVLAAGGLAGGYILSGGLDKTTDGGGATPPFVPARFALTPQDIKNQLLAPELCCDSRGRIYLVYSSQTGEAERTLFLARSDNAGRTFDAPRALARSGIYKAVSKMKGKTITRELKMSPHVVCGGEAVHVAWTETLPGDTGVRMVVSTSTDRGETFVPSQSAHKGTGARPTFTALATTPAGLLACSWLDNRNGTQQVFASIRLPGASTFEEEFLVHAGEMGKGVCPCCPTACVAAPDGTIYVAFRNLADGYRDIFIGRKKAGTHQFEGPFPVTEPAWQFNGCPHDGPSLALVGDTLHVVWMDARTGTQRCYHGQANVADLRFTARELHSAGAGSQGNARLFADDSGALHVVWEQHIGSTPEGDVPGKHQHEPAVPKLGGGSGRAIMYAALPPGGTSFGAARALMPREGAFQTRPAVVATGAGDVVFAWSELDETGRAVMVAPLSALVESGS
jgi:hypothetical protein